MAAESESVADRQGARVLVVDDSSTFRRVVGSMLEREGYVVETAASGEEAFRRCVDETFDLVVSDITMGALSGVQLCRLFRSDPATKHIPVLLLTAADDARSRFWARNAGADAYVAKERARADLLPEVARVLNARPASAMPAAVRAGRRAQPMERLSHVLDELLFRAVVSSEVRNLVHHTGDRRRFAAEFLQIAAAVADYSYLVLKLRNGAYTSCAMHARGPWCERPSLRVRELFELPNEPDSVLDVVCEGAFAEGDLGTDVRDKARFPVEVAGEALGVLIAISKDKRLGEGDRETLGLLGKELGILVKNVFLLEETKRLADSDVLTGLQNRRRANERMELELARARRYNTPFSLLLCDVDHFKTVNDTFGHNIGDEVLIKVAHRLQSVLRQVDLVARWGGEEFLVMLPDTPQEGAKVVGERMRKAIEALPPTAAGPERVTCSIGLATFAGEPSAALFIDRADQALYRAKHNGRNRVEVA